MKLNYRPDIDGLRAIAVLSVVFFHTDVPGFGGGYVGVDIFFVISGFLITSILLKDLRANDFSVARFYERRIRRIFPALFPVIVFTAAVGTYLFQASAFKGLGLSMAATTMFFSNILFWSQAGYFDTPSLQKPLLHTWSLAVEEQFYIFFPLCLAFIHRFLKGRYLRWIIIATLFSLAGCIWGVFRQPSASFYLVPTRAWELLAGSVMSLGLFPKISSYLLKNLFSFIGLGLVAYSVFFYEQSTPFPGYAAIIPVLGAVLVIYGNDTEDENVIVRKILSTPPLVFVGLISYSLYLWHWPLVAFAKYLMFRPFTIKDSLFIIILSLVMAIVSWKYVEQPFRGRNMLLPNRKFLFQVAVMVMLTVSGAGMLVYLNDGLPGRDVGLTKELSASIAKVQDDPVWKEHVKWEEMTNKVDKHFVPPKIGAESAKPSFLLIGDSHARALIPAIDYIARAYGMSGYVITRSSTPLLFGIDRMQDRNDPAIDESEYNKGVIGFIDTHADIQTVILAGRWAWYATGKSYGQEEQVGSKQTDYYRELEGNRPHAVMFRLGLSRTVRTLLDMKRQVVLVSMVPEIGNDVFRYLALQNRFPLFYDNICPTKEDYNVRNCDVTPVLQELAQNENVQLVRPENLLFDKAGRSRIVFRDQPIYRDDNHLSTFGARLVAPAFNNVFTKMSSISL